MNKVHNAEADTSYEVSNFIIKMTTLTQIFKIHILKYMSAIFALIDNKKKTGFNNLQVALGS